MLRRGCQCVTGRSSPLACTTQNTLLKALGHQWCMRVLLHLGGIPRHEVEDLSLRNQVAGQGGSVRHLKHLTLATMTRELEDYMCRQSAIVASDRGEGHIDHPARRGRSMLVHICSISKQGGVHLSNPRCGSKFSIVRIGTRGKCPLCCAACTNSCRKRSSVDLSSHRLLPHVMACVSTHLRHLQSVCAAERTLHRGLLAACALTTCLHTTCTSSHCSELAL